MPQRLPIVLWSKSFYQPVPASQHVPRVSLRKQLFHMLLTDHLDQIVVYESNVEDPTTIHLTPGQTLRFVTKEEELLMLDLTSDSDSE